MTTVFIAGSISIKHLDPMVKARIDNIVSADHEVVVGDADGADSSIQSYLSERGASHTVVYCSGKLPRNNLGNWPVHAVVTRDAKPGTRAFFTAKDLEMAKAADFGLMIWDAKSSGTLSNVIELLQHKKKSVVFVNKAKEFKTVGDVGQLEELVSFMSPPALQKIDAKIGLLKKIASLKNEQAELF